MLDDEYDQCIHCGHDAFEGNAQEWERICTNCGATSCYEYLENNKVPTPYYYKHENYFVSSIIGKAMKRGANLSHHQEHLTSMFCKSVDIFYRVKDLIGRKNYPSYQYALLKLCEYLHIDVSPYITLPKMKSTLEGIKRDWPYIDPVIN